MWNIAHNTFKEIVRNKILSLIVFFSVVFIIFSLVLGQLTLGQADKVIVDFWLAMIEIFGMIAVLFIGSQLLFREIEGKTIFLILSKPLKRQDFILGKFFGCSQVIAVILVLQSIVFLSIVALHHIPFTSLLFWTLFFTFLKLEILLAIVFFFSTFMSPMLTILVSFFAYLISHNFSLLLDLFAQMGNTIAWYAIRIFQMIFPPLWALNTKDLIGTFQAFPANYFVSNTMFALLYVTVLLFITVQIFSHKTFEN